MNKLVKTNAGSFYFVKRPDYIASSSQIRKNLIKGAKVQIVMHDPRYNTYVKFNSKADVSEYLWGLLLFAFSPSAPTFMARLSRAPTFTARQAAGAARVEKVEGKTHL